MHRGFRNACLGSLLGVLLGMAAYQMQPPHLEMMNHFGVVAFAAMGTSLGCLWEKDSARR